MNGNNILVVDDEELVRDLVKEELEAHGYQVCLAANGVEGVLAVLDGKQEIGLVIMDITMPRLNGVDALRIMKKIAPEIPVITVTGQTGSGEVSEAVRLGALTCMSKPFRVGNLLEMLDKYRDQKKFR